MAKIRKMYDEAIKPDGSKQVIYPITSTRAVYTTNNVTIDTILGEGYRFGGVVLPTDYPAFTDQRVFYGASVPGIYEHFGGIAVNGGEAVFLMFNGSTWSKGLFGGAGYSNLSGFKCLESISDLPLEETTLGYLIEDSTLPDGFPKEVLYVWVGENGDTLGGLYQNCGQLRGASAYETAVRNGYEGTEEQWLNDPVNGIKGNGIQSMSIVGEYSSEDSAVNTYRITPYVGEPFDFDVKNGKGITSVEVVGTPSTAQSAVNTYRITMSDNTTFDFQVKNGTGITTITETPSVANGGTNVIHITLSDGTSYDINVKNGTASDGFFATEALLTTAIPSPNVGDYAFVSKAADGTFPAYIYVCETAGTWTNSTQEFTTEVPQVSVSQNTSTGHTDISVGGVTTPVASVEDIDGELYLSDSMVIPASNYRAFKSVSLLNENKEGCIVISGLTKGKVSFVNSSWSSLASMDWKENKRVYLIIPANTAYIFINNYNDTPVVSDTTVNFQLYYGGLDTAVELFQEEFENAQLKQISSCNISKAYPTGGTDGTDIYTTTNARAKIPISERTTGYIISYKTDAGIILEQYLGTVFTDTDWLYGGWNRLNLTSFINVNKYHAKTDAYSDFTTAIQAIPGGLRFPGIVVVYKLSDGYHIAQLRNDSWTLDSTKWNEIITDGDILSLLKDVTNLDISVQENLIKEFIPSNYFEIGSLYNGTELVNSKHCRSKYFQINKGDVIVCRNTSIEFSPQFYDKSKTFVSATSWEGYWAESTQDGFLRLVMRNTSDTDFVLNDIGEEDIIILRILDNSFGYDALKNHTRQRVVWSQKGDFVKGYLSNGVIINHAERMSTRRYYPVKKGDKVFINSNLYSFYVTEYNESKVFIEASPYYNREYIAPGNNPTGWYVVKNDGYVRMTFSLINGTWDDSIVTTADRFVGVIPQELLYEERMAWDYLNHSKIIVEKKPFFVPTEQTIYQDGTFIGGNLWLFPENNGDIKIINPEIGALIGTKSHTLGHCSSVDYNENIDCLICKQEGSQHIQQVIQIYKNPASSNALAPTDANCTLINLYNDSFHFNDEGTGSIMWGEDKDIVYFCNGRELSETGNPNQFSNTHYIYKIQLGMGGNDLSLLENGMGVFVSGKEDDEYNGTCTILKKYTGTINEGCDTYIGESANTYFQGAQYDGYIYVGWGTSGHNFLKIELEDDYETFKVVENYMHKFYNYDRSVETFYEPELVAIHNGKIYCGSRKYAEGSVLVAFNL